MRPQSSPAWFAERTLHGVDENGAEESVVVWIERRHGAVWAVGRAVNLHYRSNGRPRPDDYVFEGYELEDALEAANATLSDDSRVSAQDGRAEPVAQFQREEVLKKLERWFFGHDRQQA